jgi:hypothetical protein
MMNGGLVVGKLWLVVLLVLILLVVDQWLEAGLLVWGGEGRRR